MRSPNLRPTDPFWKAFWFWLVAGLLLSFTAVQSITLEVPEIHSTYL